MKCRFCNSTLKVEFIDLGFSPYSNAYLDKEKLRSPEEYFPLRVFVCENCWLVQTDWNTSSESLFESDYAYFSSTSKSWVKHAKEYSIKIIEKLKLKSDNFVVEIASNDGYLLRNFKEKNIPCVGVEPTACTARVSKKFGIEVIESFFSKKLASENKKLLGNADLIIGNNVYAHVPDINDFTAGLKLTLKKGGVITLEFPHLMRLIEFSQFDTIYHEHFSYFSLFTVNKIFQEHGLRIWHVEELETHGGSLRIYGCHQDDKFKTMDSVLNLMDMELSMGLRDIQTYKNFQMKAELIKNNFLRFLLEQKNNNKKVVAYGAAAKGNTILNFAGIKKDLLSVVFDASDSKQGKYLPGSHLSIKSPDEILAHKPDFIIVLPWNILEEVREQLKGTLPSHVRFVRAVPKMEII